MNLVRSFSWALYNRLLSLIGFALGLAVAGAGAWYGAMPAYEAYMSGAPIESLTTDAAIAAGGVVGGFYVWRLVSAVAFYRTVVGATEGRIKKHSGTAQVKSAIMDQFDEHFEELESDLKQTRNSVAESDVSEIRQSVEELEEAVRELEQAVDADDVGGSASGGPPTHETIPDSTGTERRPEQDVQNLVEQEDRRTVTAPSQGNDRGTERTDGEDGFGTADERVGDGFGDGADG